jgi:hypothetical protein
VPLNSPDSCRRHCLDRGWTLHRPALIEDRTLAVGLSVVTVKWLAGIRTEHGERELGFWATYLLQRCGGSLEVVLQIDHQDLEASIEALADARTGALGAPA